MKRFHLRKGDRTTAGGTVLDGLAKCTIYGVPQTFIGASVYCPACNSTGEIVATGPRLKESLYGKEAALEGDLCACQCAPWPSLLASQNTDYQSISTRPHASTGAMNNARGFSQSKSVHDEQYVLRDARTGRPLVNVAYCLVSASGETVQGMTDGAGRTQRIGTSAAQQIKVEIKEAE